MGQIFSGYGTDGKYQCGYSFGFRRLHGHPEANDCRRIGRLFQFDLVHYRADVEFRDVSFGYPDKAHAIQHIDLNVPAGSIIGILGGTGSGKSTIISLLMRAYNVKEGSIFMDGIDIKDVPFLRSENKSRQYFRKLSYSHPQFGETSPMAVSG